MMDVDVMVIVDGESVDSTWVMPLDVKVDDTGHMLTVVLTLLGEVSHSISMNCGRWTYINVVVSL